MDIQLYTIHIASREATLMQLPLHEDSMAIASENGRGAEIRLSGWH
jgi:hypothetical protein